jgi:hypothetical protein
MQTVIYSETLLLRPHVILTYTALYLFTTVKHWSKKHSAWFMQGKLNYKYHIMFWTNTACCMLLHCAPLQLRFVLPVKWNNKVKGYNKTKSCKPFWNAKFYEFYIYRWTYCQHNYPRYVQLPKQKWKKYDNYIYHWTWQIVTATGFHSTNDFHKFMGEQTMFW